MLHSIIAMRGVKGDTKQSTPPRKKRQINSVGMKLNIDAIKVECVSANEEYANAVYFRNRGGIMPMDGLDFGEPSFTQRKYHI